MGKVKKELAKGLVSVATGFGIMVMTKTGVKILTPANAGRITKFCTKLAGVGIALKVSNDVDQCTDKVIDDIMAIERINVIEKPDDNNESVEEA